MEFKINCHADVKLPHINDLQDISCRVIDFKTASGNLTGHIEISGTYLDDENNNAKGFLEIVPFDVLFDNNYEVTDITCQNLTCQIIVGNQVQCDFDIVIEYQEDEIENKSEGEILTSQICLNNEEKDIESAINENNISEKDPIITNNKSFEVDIKENQDVIIDQTNNNEEVKNEIDIIEDKTIIIESEESLQEKLDIAQEYDDMLQEVLSARNDNFLEESNVNVAITRDSDDAVTLRQISESYGSIKVYFPTSDREVEELCKAEKLNIESAYDEYKKSKRIVVK